MDTLLNQLTTVAQALPEAFPFYSFGQVARVGTSGAEFSSLIQGKSAVSFRLLGKPEALLIVLFDSTLDLSMYSEIGNTIASQLCTKLSDGGEGDLMITPPTLVTPEQLTRLSALGIPHLVQRYLHVMDGTTIPVEAAVFPLTLGEEHAGHA